MADERSIKFRLDLDSNDFKDKITGAIESISSLSDPDKLSGLIKGFGMATVAAGGLFVAVKTIQEAFNAVMEAEDINQINKAFETLTKNAGISGEALKAGLQKAAGGLIDDTQLLKIANGALVTMGESAQRLPEILDLARKSTAVFGGELTQNFENLTRAIEMGNQRMLKHLGINIDVQQAVRRFAEANNIAVNSISEAGRKQAIMNAALEQSKVAFDGVDINSKKVTNSFQQIKVSLEEIKETLVLAFEKVGGPVIASFLGKVQELAHTFKTYIKANFSEGAEQAEAQLERIQVKIKSLNSTITELEDKKSKNPQFFDNFDASRLQSAQAELEKLNAQLPKAQENLSNIKGPEGSSGDGGESERAQVEDQDKKKKNEAKFQSEMLALKLKNNQDTIDAEDNLEAFDQEMAQQKLLLAEQLEAKKAEIRARDDLTREQMNQLIIQEEESKDAQIASMDENLYQQRTAVMDRYAKHATSAGDGIGRGFAAGSAKARLEVNEFGKAGEQTFNRFSNAASNAFIEMGKGQKTASDIAKGFVFGMLADEAEARGRVILASSIWPPNPVGIAAGAGLLALSGALRAAGGSGGSSSMGGGGSDSGGGGGGPQADFTQDTTQTPQQFAQQKKVVSINVSGHYFETESTKLALVDLIRQANDATDFNIKAVN